MPKSPARGSAIDARSPSPASKAVCAIARTPNPPFGIHNGPDIAHTGFHAHNWVITRFQPRFFLHGHQHRTYDHRLPTDTTVGRTLVINVHPYRILEL